MTFNFLKKDYHKIYEKIKNGHIPHEYKDIGKYMQIVFNHYPYSMHIVNDTVGFLSVFKEKNFDFSLFTDEFLSYFDKYSFNDYIRTLAVIDRIYVSKSHDFFVRELDKYRDNIFFDKNARNIIGEDLFSLLGRYSIADISLKASALGNVKVIPFLNSMLREFIAYVWVDNIITIDDIYQLNEYMLKNNYIYELCTLRGIDPQNADYKEIMYLAYFLVNKYKNQFTNIKVIK